MTCPFCSNLGELLRCHVVIAVAYVLVFVQTVLVAVGLQMGDRVDRLKKRWHYLVTISGHAALVVLANLELDSTTIELVISSQ